MKLSIIIPVYNEKETILEVIKKSIEQEVYNLDKEIIVVSDGSTDGTNELLRNVKNINLISYDKNMGKGHAIREGLKKVTGDIVLIQDADLELSPSDYPNLVSPILNKKTDVVYGSRILGNPHLKGGSSFYYGGRLVTFVANLLYGINITDEPVGYKIFKTEILKSLNLKCKKFEFCPEVTAKISKRGIKIYEVPVKFKPRGVKEGKKLRFKDGILAVWTLIIYKFVN